MLLKVKDLSIKLRNGDYIVKGISFNLNYGEILALVGSNGAGKSTIVRFIMGIKPRDIQGRGIIEFEGNNITKLSITNRAKLGITMGFQHDVYLDGITIDSYLELALKYREKYGINSKLDKDKLSKEWALSMVGLTPGGYLNRELTTALSGGERKRVEMAYFLLAKPKLLILDEPDSGIDMFSIDQIKKAILQLKKDGVSIILVTHDASVLNVASRGLLIGEGGIVMSGDMREVERYLKNNCYKCPYFR